MVVAGCHAARGQTLLLGNGRESSWNFPIGTVPGERSERLPELLSLELSLYLVREFCRFCLTKHTQPYIPSSCTPG